MKTLLNMAIVLTCIVICLCSSLLCQSDTLKSNAINSMIAEFMVRKPLFESAIKSQLKNDLLKRNQKSEEFDLKQAIADLDRGKFTFTFIPWYKFNKEVKYYTYNQKLEELLEIDTTCYPDVIVSLDNVAWFFCETINDSKTYGFEYLHNEERAIEWIEELQHISKLSDQLVFHILGNGLPFYFIRDGKFMLRPLNAKDRESGVEANEYYRKSYTEEKIRKKFGS